MDLLAWLCVVAFVLAVVAVVGHAIWLVVAALFHSLSGSPGPARRSDLAHRPLGPPRQPCARCGRTLDWDERDCPRCGLDRDCQLAAELTDLEAMSRQLDRFEERHDLSSEEVERLWKLVQGRHRRLSGTPQEEPVTTVPQRTAQVGTPGTDATRLAEAVEPLLEVLPVEKPPTTPVEVPSEPSWVRLERLLAGCQDVSLLSASERVRAVLLFRQSPLARLSALSAHSLLMLARLLGEAGRVDDALTVYRQLVVLFPRHPEAGAFALEAARFAVARQRTDEAASFLERALAGGLSSEERAEAERVLTGVVAQALPLAEPIPLASPPGADATRLAPPGADATRLASRRSLGELLAGFMEEKNILWGELVGGLLIVGGSVALVISLWNTLQENPYFPFGIFAAVTAALFGAGLYTLHHWKLESTSRGLLVIATLLVPLCFTVLPSMLQEEAGDNLELLIACGGLLVFTFLISQAGRVLVPGGSWLLTLAILGCAASQLLGARLLGTTPARPALIMGLGCLPLACQGVGIGLLLWRLGRTEWPVASGEWRVTATASLLALVGLATFSLALALGVFISRSGNEPMALRHLSLLIAGSVVPVLASGLLLHTGLAGAPKLVGLRTTGTAVALAAVAVMLVAVALAWPLAEMLLAVCALNFVVLTWAAFRRDLPVAQVAALPCLALAYLLAFHLSAGVAAASGTALLLELVSAHAGTKLAVLALILAVIGEVLTRRGWRPHALAYSVGAGLVALVSLVLATWHGPDEPGHATVIYGINAALAWHLTWRFRWRALAWLGSILLLVGLVYLLTWTAELTTPRLAALALLLHASTLLVPVLMLRGIRRTGDVIAALQHLFAGPLEWAALVSTFLALPILVLLNHGVFLLRAEWLAWLAALWLLTSWMDQRRWLFASFQAVLCVAVGFAVTAWLEEQPWVLTAADTGLWDPRSLQAYGLGLAGLCLVWTVSRIALQQNDTGRGLMLPDWPGVDRFVLGLLLLGQMALADWGVVRGALSELVPHGYMVLDVWPAVHVHAYGPGAWLLLAGLALVCLVGVWQPAPGHRQAEAVLGLFVLLATVPVLWAGPFATENATASALRWGLTAAFLIGSVLLWLRVPLIALGEFLRIPSAGSGLSGRVRRCLLDFALVPVLILTIVIAVLVIAGKPPTGPVSESFYRLLGGPFSLLIPVAVLSVGLVGHAFRERSAGYAFSAGLLLLGVATGGYTLSVIRAGEAFGNAEWVQLIQIGSITASVWALLWLLSRHWLTAWREDAERPLAWPLMSVQIGMAVVGNAFLLVTAVMLLVSAANLDVAGAGDWLAAALEWTTTTGSLLGWLALGLTALAGCTRSAKLPGGNSAGVLGFAAVALLACTAESLFPESGYRTLLVGWAGYALAWSLLARQEAAPLWVILPAFLAVALAVGAAQMQEDHLWAAGAIAVASTGGVVLAGRRQHGAGVLLACLGFNLAASFVLWHVSAEEPLELWWVPLLQINAPVSAAGALVWLSLRSRPAEPATLRDPLSVQVGLGLLFTCIYLGVAFMLLYLWPGGPMDRVVIQAGQPVSWATLILVGTAVILYVQQRRPAAVVHALGGVGLLLAILLAASFSPWDTGGWFAYHVLTSALLILAGAMLGAGWIGSEAQIPGPVPGPNERGERFARLLAECFPATAARHWVEGLGIVLVGLAVRGTLSDPAAPYWPAGMVLMVSLLAGVLAFWSCRPIYVPLSGVLLFLAGLLAWAAWGSGELDSFLYACILCLGIASVLWSLLEGRLRRRLAGKQTPADPAAVASWSVGTVAGLILFIVLTVLFAPALLASTLLADPGGQALAGLCLAAVVVALVLLLRLSYLIERQLRWLELAGAGTDETPGWTFPFSQAAGLLGLGLLTIVIGVGLGSDLTESGIRFEGPLAWTSWGMMVAAGLAMLWDRGLRAFPLYLAGLLGVGLLLHGLALPPDDLLWFITLALAGYTLVAVLIAQAGPRMKRLWQLLRLPTGQQLEDWMFPFQFVLTGVALALSVWVSFAFAARLDRLAGPLTVAFLTATWVVWTRLREQEIALSPLSVSGLRYGVLLLGALVSAEVAWALPGHADPAAWLHRDVLLFTALALTAAVYALGLRRLLPHQERWAECAERLGPRLGAVALLVVLVVLGQELALYDPALRRVPIAPWATALVAVTLIGLSAAALCFAVMPHVDPLALPERRRPLYVYAAELVLVLLFLHVRLTMPFLFRGTLAQYWPFLLMGLAFLGVGLAEVFERRNLRVLADPLQKTGIFLPLLPLLAFWLQPAIAPLLPPAAGRARSLPPFLEHAGVWYLLGLLYAWVAVTRRSSRFALLAALSVNFGTWGLLYHYREAGVGFLAHPQLWLIPLALILLAAEHINRDRLPAAQALALRYFGLILLYVSSTADLFLAGMGDIGLSLVLAVLSVLGVLAGIQFRVRAFLFAGLTFLLLVIFARIWYAAVTQAQTWVWWVSLIVLGVAILALFAVFEKRRNDVLRLVEELKRWK